VRMLLPGPAADALGILVGHPELGAVAEEEGLAQLLPPGPLADLARDLSRGPIALDAALARLEATANQAVITRVRELAGPARLEPQHADRELRRSAVKARLERLDQEYAEALKRGTRAGSAGVDDLHLTTQRLLNQIRDQKKRLRSLERPG
jgi:DNA primase